MLEQSARYTANPHCHNDKHIAPESHLGQLHIHKTHNLVSCFCLRTLTDSAPLALCRYTLLTSHTLGDARSPILARISPGSRPPGSTVTPGYTSSPTIPLARPIVVCLSVRQPQPTSFVPVDSIPPEPDLIPSAFSIQSRLHEEPTRDRSALIFISLRAITHFTIFLPVTTSTGSHVDVTGLGVVPRLQEAEPTKCWGFHYREGDWQGELCSSVSRMASRTFPVHATSCTPRSHCPCSPIP